MNYYIIIPAYNEARFIALTLDSIINQSLPPKKVIVVNDSSTDTTPQIIDSYTHQYKWIEKVDKVSISEHLPGSKVVEAFNEGLKKLDNAYDFIVKLDADLILPKTYFESVAQMFKEDPKIGVSGGFAYEEDKEGKWELNHPMNKNHVRGAFKAYSKACFSKINGLKNAMGWDTVDELLAQFHGFKIQTNSALKVKHLRPTGKSYTKKARYLQGEAMYKMRYDWSITTIAALKMAFMNRSFSTFINTIKGYYYAQQRKTEQVVSPEEGAFIRKLRWKGILSKLKY